MATTALASSCCCCAASAGCTCPHVQFNVVSAATLRAAQANPDEYRSLVVRVAGYSAYFTNWTRILQLNEIIS
jgi:pyruvate-formate lyase